METQKIDISSSRYEILKDELNKEYFSNITSFLAKEKNEGKTIYPSEKLIFNAFNTTPFDNVKVVILGQDPYHGESQAHGLSFSVPAGLKFPPSLRNIFQELQNDIGVEAPTSGDLTHRANQGVLLLNAILTVRANEPASHSKIGRQQFTDSVIRKISDEKENIVFILWGKFAQQKNTLINSSKHLILSGPHPSPFSAYTGFFGCKHFSKTNTYLENKGIKKIIR